MSATPEPKIAVPADMVGSGMVGSGKSAGVQVDEKPGTEMSAFGHDLRGAFGACWGKIVLHRILNDADAAVQPGDHDELLREHHSNGHDGRSPTAPEEGRPVKFALKR